MDGKLSTEVKIEMRKCTKAMKRFLHHWETLSDERREKILGRVRRARLDIRIWNV